MKPLRSASSHRGAAISAVALLGVALTIAACSGGDSTSPPPGGGDQDVWKAVASRAWAISALTESYECYGAQVSADEYITGFRLAAPSAAQTELLLFVLDAPPTLGSFDCASSTASGHLIYAAGIGTTPIEFRTGQGVHVAAGKYLLLNIHIVNASDVHLTDSTRIEGRVGTASAVTTPLEMVLTGKLSFTIPAGDASVLISGGCNVLSEQHFVALIPIMRALGVHQSVNMSPPNDTVAHAIHDASFSPTHVLYDSFTSDIFAPAGSHVSTTCTFVNTTGHAVTVGESAQNEYCFTGIYRYPVATGTYDFLACARGAGLDLRRPES